MPASILEKIVSEKKREVAAKARSLPLAALKERLAARKTPRDFAAALRGDNIKLIAEVKKASPSRGVLVRDFDPLALASTYARSGAAAISVLTEVAHFQGSLEYLAAIRDRVSVPLLRKDFIFDAYQVYESAVSGADALLLIASILSPEQLGNLLELSHSLGLACLVEVHDEREMDKALKSGAEIIGINNRDLKTFKVDIETTHRLRPLVPGGKIVVSESGIGRRDDVIKLKAWGVDAILVGEALVTAQDIPARIKELLS
jgi:indole-3-glycerol phosphate synthase